LARGGAIVVVRGTSFNTGTRLEKAITAGAGSVGHWGGCHASPQDLGAPRVGDLSVSDRMSRYSYPFSVMVNLEGKRFMDEGESHFGLTYTKTGGAIGGSRTRRRFRSLIKTLYLLEPQYNEERSMKWKADSFEELGEKMGWVSVNFVNETTGTVDFDPTRLDGSSTGQKLKVTKTH